VEGICPSPWFFFPIVSPPSPRVFLPSGAISLVSCKLVKPCPIYVWLSPQLLVLPLVDDPFFPLRSWPPVCQHCMPIFRNIPSWPLQILLEGPRLFSLFCYLTDRFGLSGPFWPLVKSPTSPTNCCGFCAPHNVT